MRLRRIVLLIVCLSASVIAQTESVHSSEGIGSNPAEADVVLVGETMVRTPPGTLIRLHGLDDGSFSAVMSRVRTGGAIAEAPVLGGRYFIFRGLRPGIYALSFRNDPRTHELGPPVPLFVEGGNYEVRWLWHGGDIEYGVSAFEIRLAPPRSGRLTQVNEV